MKEDGSIRKPASLLPALDKQYALSVRSPYILVHELLDLLVKNKGTYISYTIHIMARWQ